MDKKWLMKNCMLKIHISTWIYLAICFYFRWYKESLLLFSIILIHEYSHFFVAKYFSYDIDEIVLYPIGAFLKIKDYGTHTILEDFLVAIAGACSHLFFIGISPVFKEWLGVHLYRYYLLFHQQILFFNLLPIYPMDGSKIIFCFFRCHLSYLNSLQMTLYTSFVAYILMFSFEDLIVSVFLGYQLYLFSQNYEEEYLKYLVYKEYKQSKKHSFLDEKKLHKV